MKLTVYSAFLALVVASLSSLALAAAAQTATDRKPTLDLSSCPAVSEFPATARLLDPDRETPSVTVRLDVGADGKLVSVAIKEKSVSARLANWLRMNFRNCTFTPALSAGTPVPGTAVFILKDAKEPTLGGGKLLCDFSSLSKELAYADHRGSILIRIQTGSDSAPREVTVEESSNSESVDRSVQELAMNCKPTAKASPNEFIVVKLHLQR